jgi:hypothetical protein
MDALSQRKRQTSSANRRKFQSRLHEGTTLIGSAKDGLEGRICPNFRGFSYLDPSQLLLSMKTAYPRCFQQFFRAARSIWFFRAEARKEDTGFVA